MSQSQRDLINSEILKHSLHLKHVKVYFYTLISVKTWNGIFHYTEKKEKKKNKIKEK